MTNLLFLPALVGTALGLILCAVLASRQQRPSFWMAIWVALAAGISTVALEYGTSLVRPTFWTQEKAPGIEVVPCVFGLGAVAALVSSAVVIGLYRARRVQ